MKLSQQLAGKLASSVLLKAGKQMHEANPDDPNLSGNYWHKALANLYLICRDYADGLFPPVLTSREKTFEQERQQLYKRKNVPFDENVAFGMGKPANHPLMLLKGENRGFERIVELLEKRGVNPGATVLECGCGQGWLSELLAIRGYRVTGTCIAPINIETARKRIPALVTKGLDCHLDFVASPMEELHDRLAGKQFDVVFCYAALHHVFDWRESLQEMTRCLRVGGLLMLADEPPRLHTWLAYRSSKALATHEIGFNIRDVVRHIKNLGYEEIKVTRPVTIDGFGQFWKIFSPITFGNGLVAARPFWLVAKKQ